MGERDRELETIKCPACGANTRTKVKKDTALVFFPLYCQKCKKELRITWVDGQQPDGRHDRRRCRCGFPGAGEVIFLSIA